MSALALLSSLLLIATWSCERRYTLGPLPIPTPVPPTATLTITLTRTIIPTPTITLTPTLTATPTVTSTPICGFTSIYVPTPVTAPSGPGTFFYVIRTLADWQNYFGSASPPAPEATLGSQMILINLQSIAVTQYILPYLPYTTICDGETDIYESDTNYPTPGPVYNYTVKVQNVCWTPSQVTVSYDQYANLCSLSIGPVGPPIILTPIALTPIPWPTPAPTATPSPPGSPCNPGETNVIYIYEAVGVAVPASTAPVLWSQVGSLQNPEIYCVYPG